MFWDHGSRDWSSYRNWHLREFAQESRLPLSEQWVAVRSVAVIEPFTALAGDRTIGILRAYENAQKPRIPWSTVSDEEETGPSVLNEFAGI